MKILSYSFTLVLFLFSCTTNENNNDEAIQKYANNWNEYYKTIDNLSYSEFYSQNPKQFMEYTDKLYDLLLDHFEQFVQQNQGINDEFISQEKNRIKYFVYEKKCNYNGFMQNQIPEDFKNEFYAFLKNVSLNDTSLFSVGGYFDFLKSYVRLEQRNRIKQTAGTTYDPSLETKIIFDIIEEKLTNPIVVEKVLYPILSDQIAYFRVDEELMKRFCASNILCISDEAKKAFTNYFESMKPVFSGNNAPDFTLYDADGKEYSLVDFRSKYLFLDVWEASCSPCIREIPYLHEIEKALEGKNIVFAQVSLDKSDEKWQNMVAKLKLYGLQLIAKDGWKSAFANDYKIKATPRYILIDPQGKIYLPNTPKPSQNLEQVLNGISDL